MTQIADVDTLVGILTRDDATDDAENLTMLAHLLQCAAELERDAPDDVELQVAGLVHDIGTILEPGQPLTHGPTGGDAVRDLLGARVADLVTQHDQAKRYLVTTDPGYHDLLSAQSIATLEVQGGPFDDAACRAFEQRPHFEACIMLRRADDAAKVPGRDVPPIAHWRAALEARARSVRPQ